MWSIGESLVNQLETYDPTALGEGGVQPGLGDPNTPAGAAAQAQAGAAGAGGGAQAFDPYNQPGWFSGLLGDAILGFVGVGLVLMGAWLLAGGPSRTQEVITTGAKAAEVA